MIARFITFALVVVFCQAFRPMARVSSNKLSMSFDLDKVLSTLASNKVITKTAQLGLLSRLEKAGFTVKTAAPLLVLADKYDALGVLEASSDKVLPLAAKAIELAPALLPLAGTALKTSPTVLYGGAAVSVVAAVSFVNLIPDDSVSSIALQTLIAVPLGAIIPGALGVGGFVLSKLK